MILHRVFEIRLYPSIPQRKQIDINLLASEQVWNHFLPRVLEVLNNTTYESPRFFCNTDYAKEVVQLKKLEEHELWAQADCTALRGHINRLQQAHDKARYWKNRLPKPKDYNANKHSYTTENTGRTRIGRAPAIEIDLEKRKIKLPKLGWVKFRSGPIPWINFDGRMITEVTIKVEQGPKYYGYLRINFPHFETPLLTDVRAVGIDPGIETFLTLSTGEKIQNPRFYQEILRRKIALNDKMHRAMIDPNYKLNKDFIQSSLKLANLEKKLANKRDYFRISTVNYLVENFDIIYIERLSSSRLRANVKIHNINASYQDLGFFDFYTYLASTCQYKGKLMYLVSEKYGASKKCHVCGFINQYLDADKTRPGYERFWICPQCGTYLDRDINAAHNILNLGWGDRIAPYINQYEKDNNLPLTEFHLIKDGQPNIVYMS